jgi:hypothetical protein
MNSVPLVGLRWALKRSFLDYIERAPGGRGALSDGAVATEFKEIVFAPDTLSPPASPGHGLLLAFRGTVTFSAHAGLLLVPIANPWVLIAEGQGELTVHDPFQREGVARLKLATFDIDDHVVADGFEHWAATNVRLAPEGCPLFNNVYPASELLEPLTIIIPGVDARAGA